jgi:hypothetical protein
MTTKRSLLQTRLTGRLSVAARQLLEALTDVELAGVDPKLVADVVNSILHELQSDPRMGTAELPWSLVRGLSS